MVQSMLIMFDNRRGNIRAMIAVENPWFVQLFFDKRSFQDRLSDGEIRVEFILKKVSNSLQEHLFQMTYMTGNETIEWIPARVVFSDVKNHLRSMPMIVSTG